MQPPAQLEQCVVVASLRGGGGRLLMKSSWRDSLGIVLSIGLLTG